MRVPDEWPDGRFDLIVISEVLYYLDPADVRRIAVACRDSLEPRGTIVLVNWAPRPCYADEAVALFCAELNCDPTPETGFRTDLFRLDVLCATA